MREHFLLDPTFAFLNHGSFGACPKPVFEAYQQWQYKLERQPVRFFQREANDLLNQRRDIIAPYLNAAPETLHFVRNATVGINYIARSIALQAGDEVLTTNHEYGAMDATWTYICQQRGAIYRKCDISIPYHSDADFIEQFWRSVTDRTKVIFLSHITSPTAIIFPVREICQRARAAGIITVVDGAHAPGQIPLDLSAIDADYYAGNFHKWLCAPKSAGFMVAHPERQNDWYPLIVSWGWIRETEPVSRLQWKGTEDIAAYLAVTDAIDFQAAHDWQVVRRACHTLAVESRQQIMALFDLPAPLPDENFAQMFIAELPPCEAKTVQDALYHEYRVEVPIIEWGDRQFARVSIQAYNTPQDVERLLHGLKAIFQI